MMRSIAPGAALQIADHLADGRDRAGDDHRVKHECRQIAGGDAASEHVVPADPQHDADGAEHQENHQRDQQSALAHACNSGRERRLDARCEQRPIVRLVAVGLDRADLVQRFVDVCADLGDAVLARARQPPHAASEQDDGQHDQRHDQQDQQRELRAGDEEQRETRRSAAAGCASPSRRWCRSRYRAARRRSSGARSTSPVRVVSKNPGESVSR